MEEKSNVMEEKINELANELISGMDNIDDINTLCDFGQLGLMTPKELVTAFYNSMNKNK